MRYPQPAAIATQANLHEAELNLQKEIKEVGGKLRLKIEAVRLEIKQLEGRLQKEIDSVRWEIKNVEVRLTQAIHGQTVRLVLAVGEVTGVICWLDIVLK